jgi:hypothetical protein
MAVRPCANAVNCEGSDFPISNYSSEGPEQDITYYSVVFPESWQNMGCLNLCTSFESQEAADLCALAQEAECANDDGNGSEDDGGGSGGDGPADGAFPPPPPTTVTRHFNDAQSCCVLCSDGTSFCYVVPARTFSNWTQAAADAQAYALACKLAKTNKLCLSDLDTCICKDTAYSGTITASAVKPLAWSIVSGDLPDGLALSSSVTTNGSVYIIGTPTTTGAFTFTVMALQANGSYATREYTMNVLDIVNTAMDEFTIGTPYIWTFQGTGGAGVPYYRFTIVDGTLPAGLTMDEYGRITGTPTEGGDHTFTIEMEDIETCA